MAESKNYYQMDDEAKALFNKELNSMLRALQRISDPEHFLASPLLVEPDVARELFRQLYSYVAWAYKELAPEQELARERLRTYQDRIEQVLEREADVHLGSLHPLIQDGVQVIWLAIAEQEDVTNDEPLFQLLVNLSHITSSSKDALEQAELALLQSTMETSIAKRIEEGKFDDYYIHKLVAGLRNASTLNEFRRIQVTTLRFISRGPDIN